MPEVTVLPCPCGAKVRWSERYLGKRLGCPRCQAELATPDRPAVPTDPHRPPVTPVAAGTCPICQTALGTEPRHHCEKCDTPHHAECWTEIGGCGIYGCAAAHDVPKETPQNTQSGAWGDYKDCPRCGNRLRSTALRCRSCRAAFDTTDPMTRREYRESQARAARLASLKTNALVQFGLSVVGCLSPVMFLVSLFSLVPRRRELAQVGPIYPVLAYIAVGLSFVFSLLMTVGIALSR